MRVAYPSHSHSPKPWTLIYHPHTTLLSACSKNIIFLSIDNSFKIPLKVDHPQIIKKRAGMEAMKEGDKGGILEGCWRQRKRKNGLK